MGKRLEDLEYTSSTERALLKNKRTLSRNRCSARKWGFKTGRDERAYCHVFRETRTKASPLSAAVPIMDLKPKKVKKTKAVARQTAWGCVRVCGWVGVGVWGWVGGWVGVPLLWDWEEKAGDFWCTGQPRTTPDQVPTGAFPVLCEWTYS